MDKQKTVNSLAHNDDFSKALMESYTRWTGGAGFQNSTIKEEEIPTGQKQGGTTFASFDTPIGSVPAPAEDSSTTLPTIEKQKPDDGSTKDPKATSNGGDPAIALKGSMTMGQGSMSGGVPQSQGQTLQYTNVVSKEEVEPVDESKKKAKKDYDGDGKVESGKAEYFGSKDKAIKKAMKKEDSTYGYDKKGNSLNPKDIMKKKAKKRLLPKMKESIAMEATLATARKNIGKDPKKASCWKGYKATGTKMKGGKSVPDCKPK